MIESKPTSTYNGEQQPQLSPPPPPPNINPDELLGKTFLRDPLEDGQRFSVKIIQLVQVIVNNPTMVKSLLLVNNDMSEEIITYNPFLQYLSKDEENDVLWKFRRIVSHQGTFNYNHYDYNGYPYSDLIECENGEITKEPLHNITRDDHVTRAIHD